MSEQNMSVALDRDHRGMNLDGEEIAMEVKNWNLYYGSKQALQNINMQLPKNRVTAFIGPSGCGK